MRRHYIKGKTLRKMPDKWLAKGYLRMYGNSVEEEIAHIVRQAIDAECSYSFNKELYNHIRSEIIKTQTQAP